MKASFIVFIGLAGLQHMHRCAALEEDLEDEERSNLLQLRVRPSNVDRAREVQGGKLEVGREADDALSGDLGITTHRVLSDKEANAFADAFEADPETKLLDDADDAYEQAVLDGQDVDLDWHPEWNSTLSLSQVDAASLTDVAGGLGGLVKHHAASNSTYVISARSIANLTTEERIRYTMENLRIAFGNCNQHCSITLGKGEHDVAMLSSKGAIMTMNNFVHVKVLGELDYNGNPATNFNLHGYDRSGTLDNSDKTFIFHVVGGNDVMIKNVRIRLDQSCPNHFVANVDSVNGNTVEVTVDSGYGTVPSNFFAEHFMQLEKEVLTEPKSLKWKVGRWEAFSDADSPIYTTTQLAHNRFRIVFTIGSLVSALQNKKLLVIHQKRVAVGVKAENVDGLTLTHLKFGSFPGAAINGQQMKRLVIYGLKAQTIHNQAGDPKKHWWRTVNDAAWIRGVAGKGHRMTKCKMEQLTDDYFNWHTYSPKVADAPAWFWKKWVGSNGLVTLYNGKGEVVDQKTYQNNEDSWNQELYAVATQWTTSDGDPVNGNRGDAALQIKDVQVYNSRARGMLKVPNAWLRNITVKWDMMIPLALEAELCGLWREGVPARNVLVDEFEIENVGIGDKSAWNHAVKIGTVCNGVYGHAHSNIKLMNFEFNDMRGTQPLHAHNVDGLVLRNFGGQCGNYDAATKASVVSCT